MKSVYTLCELHIYTLIGNTEFVRKNRKERRCIHRKEDGVHTRRHDFVQKSIHKGQVRPSKLVYTRAHGWWDDGGAYTTSEEYTQMRWKCDGVGRLYTRRRFIHDSIRDCDRAFPRVYTRGRTSLRSCMLCISSLGFSV